MNLPDRSIAEIIAVYANPRWEYPQWVRDLDDPGMRPTKLAMISENSMAMDEIKSLSLDEIDWHKLAENSSDWAVDLVLENLDRIDDWYFFARNENDRAIAVIDKILRENNYEHNNRDADHPLYEFDEMLSANPKRIDFLREHPEFINPPYLMWNPAAKELIDEFWIPIITDCLCNNKAEWAVNIVLRHASEIDDHNVSGNVNPRAVAHVIAHPELIDWDEWSANPTAIDHILANKDKVRITVYSNPAVMVPVARPELVDLLMQL